MTTIKVRQPPFDFSDVSPQWSPNLEIAHGMNASGIIPAYIEPYLIKVMRKAKAELDPLQHSGLLADIDAFIRQEAQHYKFHASLNKMIRDGGYERMAEFEAAYAADYERFLATKPLSWHLAYCEGFEALGSASAGFMLSGDFDDQFGDADRRPIDLWKWHLAEEYEHRNVVFQTYKAICGGQPIRAWLRRVRGFLFCARHLFGHTSKLKSYLIDVDRARMSPAEVELSKRRVSNASRKEALRRLPGVLKILSPFYDPAALPPPTQLESVLARYSSAITAGDDR